MTSDPARQVPSNLPKLKWRRSTRFTVIELLLGLGIFALLKKLHRDGILLASLSRWQFIAVVLGGILLVAGGGPPPRPAVSRPRRPPILKGGTMKLVLAMVLLLAGCGGGSDTPACPPPLVGSCTNHTGLFCTEYAGVPTAGARGPDVQLQGRSRRARHLVLVGLQPRRRPGRLQEDGTGGCAWRSG